MIPSDADVCQGPQWGASGSRIAYTFPPPHPNAFNMPPSSGGLGQRLPRKPLLQRVGGAQWHLPSPWLNDKSPSPHWLSTEGSTSPWA